MFGIGFFEIVIVVAVALIFVGPQQLPQLARHFARFFVQLRRMSFDVKATIDDAIKQAEHDLIQEEREKIQKLLADNKEEQEDNSHVEGSISTSSPYEGSHADDGSFTESSHNDGHPKA